MKQERNGCVFRSFKQGIFSFVVLITVLFFWMNFTASISSGAPASPGDKWKIAFDPAIDLPYNYSTAFKPKVWLYNQNNSLVSSGSTVSYTYVNVNTGSTIASGTATNNGDGSYTGGAINMPAYDRNYINIKFSVPQNSNVISQQISVFGDNSEASKGAVWKISVFNTSYGPSWDRAQKHNVYMTLYSDARTPMKNQVEAPTITIKNLNGTILNSSTMTYLENGIYQFTLAPNTISSDGEYYFEITSRWSSRTVTGGKSRYTTAIAGFNIEAVGNMGDTIAPDVVNWKQSPNFPTPIDNVTLSVDVVDNVNVSSVTAYYSVNNGSTRSISMYDGTFTYSGKISKYLMEDHIRYRISANDGVNVQDGPITDYVVSESAGSPNTSFSYLNHPVYYFGYSRAGTTYDEGGDTGGDGTWTTGEKDGVYYMQANAQVYTFFRDMTTIKIKTMVLDSKGKPVRGLKNVTAWLQANKTQPANARNANKTLTEIDGEDGVYLATWEGSPAMNGNSVTWNNDARVIWGKYDSGQIYSVYVDFNNDSVADENITWLAYTFMDTFVGSTQDGKGLHGSSIESSNSCGRACHQGMVGSTSRIDAEPTCADCHGVEKTANGGSWPISGNTAATDKILYGNSSSHSRLNTSGNSTYCGDESCHNSPWGAMPVNPAPIPGYNPGESLNKMFNNSGYPVPSQCAECHNYTSRTIPSVDGHNAMINCKFCHGSYHRQHKLTDYIVTSVPVKDDVIRGTPGYVGTGGEKGSGKYPGNCYKDCHKTQVEHSLVGRQGNPINEIVPCDECHENFDNKSMHLDDVGPYDDRNTCGGCHQVNQTATHNKSYSMNPPIVTDPVRHSENITGNKWNRTGTRPFWAEYENSCRFCHGRSYNDAYGLGRNRDHMGNNRINGTINSTSYWCASCHVDTYQSGNTTFNDMVKTYNDSFGVVPPEITGNTTWMSDRPGYINHQTKKYMNKSNSSSFSDDECYICHGSLANSSSMTAFMHNVDLGRSAQEAMGGPDCISCHDVDEPGADHSVNNTAITGGIHANLNSKASNSSWAPAANKKCWGCHDSNGSQPSNISMGSRYKEPFKCHDCHNSTSKPYANVSNALNVSEHFKSGEQIRSATTATNNSLSCLICHNLSEMKVPFSEDDTFISNYSIVSHYGKKRTDLRSWASGNTANCSYCHQNASTAFAGAMINAAYNRSIQNHSLSNSPTCFNTTCHNTGWLHNSTLTKPVLPLPNTTFCQNCHADRQKHNNTQNCSSCHINATSNDTIHPIKYVQTTGIFATTSTQAANCTNCHQAKLPGFTSAPIIPDPAKHSSNISNGMIWGTFWTLESGSCYYCHNDTKHNATALGKINALNNSNNVKNGNLNTTGWCSDCHYNATANANYKGNQWNPVPPLINIDNTGKSGWYNHSGSLSGGYNDSVCTLCHSMNGSYSSTSLNYSHSLDEGKGCNNCHAQPPSGTIRYNMTGAHDLHKAKGYGSVPETSCDYCHSTGGKNENGHPNVDDNATVTTNGSVSILTYVMIPASGNDDTCAGVSCHSNGLSNASKVGTSIWNSSTAGKCNFCHSTATTGLPPTGNHTKHYTNENYSCAECHGANADAGTQTGHKTNASIDINFTNVSSGGSIDGSKTCTVECHSPNSNDVKTKPIWNISSVACGDCHSLPPTTTRNNKAHPTATIEECNACHGSGASIGTQLGHINGAIDTTSDSCITCHDIGGISNATIDIASIGMHSNVNNTDSGITNADCMACHFNTDDMNLIYRILPGVNVYTCNDCHLNEISRAKVSEHYPSANINVTTMGCENCHSNSLNTPNSASTVNTTIGNVTHYGTTTNLVKPTAGTYNTACNICHNSATNKTLYGVENKQVTLGHTSAATCDECHVNSSSSAETLHNVSLEMPVNNGCLVCHTTNADKYGAPNITDTPMDNYPTSCNTASSCHGTISGINSLDTLEKHNVDMTYAGTGGSTDTVYLNGEISLAVTKGAIVNITSRVNDRQKTGGASRIGGAEYYIGTDPGQGKGTPMRAADGYYDALQTTWENVTATIDTNSLSGGTYIINVRGMDIGKQWSATKNATLIVQAFGYINGTVTNGTGTLISGVYVSTIGDNDTTGSDGKYSLIVSDGNYTVNASKQPEFYDDSVSGKVVTPLNTTTVDIIMDQKPTGTISGDVTNI